MTSVMSVVENLASGLQQSAETAHIHLPLLVLLPFLACVVTACLPRSSAHAAKPIGLFASICCLLLATWVLWRTDWALDTGLQWIQRVPWITTIGIEWHFGVDPVSALMSCCVAAVFVVAQALSGGSGSPDSCSRSRVASLCLFQATATGVLVAADSMLWFMFLQASIVPCWILQALGIRENVSSEGGARSDQSALFVFAGSMILLVGLSALWSSARAHGATALDFAQLSELWRQGKLRGDEFFGLEYRTWVGGALVLGSCTICGLFPFHVWWAAALRKSDTSTACVIAGVLPVVLLTAFVRLGVPFGFSSLLGADGPFYVGVMATVTVAYAVVRAMFARDWTTVVSFAVVAHVGAIVLSLSVASQMAVVGAYLSLALGAPAYAYVASIGKMADRDAGFLVDARHRVLLLCGVAVALGAPCTGLCAPRILSTFAVAEAPGLHVLAVVAAIAQITFGVAFWRRWRVGRETADGTASFGLGSAMVLAVLVIACVALGATASHWVDLVHETAKGVVVALNEATVIEAGK